MSVLVRIKTDSHFRVDRSRIRTRVSECLVEKRVKGNVEVSVTIVGDRMMKHLNRTYRGIQDTTDVLSFPLLDQSAKSPFIDPPDGVLRLGDIVISYPQVIEEARENNVRVDETIDALIVHSMMHLLGIHHD